MLPGQQIDVGLVLPPPPPCVLNVLLCALQSAGMRARCGLLWRSSRRMTASRCGWSCSEAGGKCPSSKAFHHHPDGEASACICFSHLHNLVLLNVCLPSALVPWQPC